MFSIEKVNRSGLFPLTHSLNLNFLKQEQDQNIFPLNHTYGNLTTALLQ